MKTGTLTVVAAGLALLLASPAAMAQQDRGGLGGALDTLNRTLNPDQERERDRDRRVREDRSGGDVDARGYRQYSDRDLRDEADRLDRESRQLDRERRALEDEMARRGIRR